MKKGDFFMNRLELKAEAKKQISGKIVPPFSLSLCMVYLTITKNENVQVSDVFKGFENMGKAVWLEIITRIFTFLWSLLLIIPGIIKSYSYSMAFYILADNPQLTAKEALEKSKIMMEGHKLDLLMPSDAAARKYVGNTPITYDVLRDGY